MFLHLEHLWSALFGDTEHERCISTLTQEDLISWYSPSLVGRHTALLPYQEPAVRSTITLTKYKYHPHATALLAAVVRHHIASQGPLVIVPIPLSKKRLRTRGYNQCQIIADRVMQTLPHAQVAPQLLRRTRDTIPQTSLSRSQRLTNVQHAFAVNQAVLARLPADSPLVLFDDVTTTGATLESASKALAAATTRPITSLALAH